VTDMVEWLRGAIDGAELAAEQATSGPWVAHSPGFVDVEPVSRGRFVAMAAEVNADGSHVPLVLADAEHIALHDPKAVLARCVGDRKTLSLHRLDGAAEGRLRGFCVHCGWRFPCPDVRNLAHNGYGYREAE